SLSSGAFPVLLFVAIAETPLQTHYRIRPCLDSGVRTHAPACVPAPPQLVAECRPRCHFPRRFSPRWRWSLLLVANRAPRDRCRAYLRSAPISSVRLATTAMRTPRPAGDSATRAPG